MGNTLYYAAMSTTPSGGRSFYAGRSQSVDLCSVSACDPHVITYPEPGFAGASAETGSVGCPRSPSAVSPCTLTINVKAGDVGGPSKSTLLEEVGGYAFAASHQQGVTTNAQALADNVPLEVDGDCCFNFTGNATAGPLPASAIRRPAKPAIRLTVRPRITTVGCRRFSFHATARQHGRRRPLKGATITFAGKHARTGRRGNASISACLRRPRSVRARARKRGFRDGHVKVVARRAADDPRFTG
jgi:hypothetical protein